MLRPLYPLGPQPKLEVIGGWYMGAPAAGRAAFSPLSLSPRLLPDPSDLSTLFQERTGASATTPSEVDGVVGTMLDKSGNGNHMVAPSDGARPILRNSGSLYWLEFPGTDDFLRVAFALDQPYERVMAFRQITWTSGDRLWDGATGNSGGIFQDTSSANLAAFAGSQVNLSNEALDTDQVLTERWNGASSRFAIDNNSYVEGDIGAADPEGLIIGAFGDQGSSFCNIRFYGGAVFAGADLTDANIADLRTYFAAKQGRVL